LPSTNRLPSKDVQMVYQDKDGFIWFATRYGLCQYDGYELRIFKSNYQHPDLLTSNNIQCLAEDNNDQLWIGTQDGLNILDKKTGNIREIEIKGIYNNLISCILVTKDNVVWVGTDSGLCRYIAADGTFVVYGNNETNNVLTTTSIKSLVEDSNGDIWIGTWSKGLCRYSPENNQFYAYPKVNDRNSAFFVFEDSKKHIWVGSWDEGLHLLNDRNELKTDTWSHFKHDPANPASLSDNIIYSITEDPNTNTLWIGTRGGFSIMDLDKPGFFTTYSPGSQAHPFPANEVNSIMRDRAGSMWIGTIGYGVYKIKTDTPKFKFNRFFTNDIGLASGTIRRMLVDKDNQLWLCIGSYGAFIFDRKTNKLTSCLDLPEFKGIDYLPTVNAIIQKKSDHEIWLGTHNDGIFVYKKGRKVQTLTPDNTSFIQDYYVTAILEDSRNNVWVGTRYGVGVLYANGKGQLLNQINAGKEGSSMVFVRAIIEDNNQDIWVGSINAGIIRVNRTSANGKLVFKHFSKENGLLKTNSVLCLFNDVKGNLWAGTEGGGLYLYRPEKDFFEEKTQSYQLPCDLVASIQEDEKGRLWLGTNVGLICLSLSDNLNNADLRIYTTVDGLQDNYFIAESSYRYGKELLFGGVNGFNSFYPDKIGDVRMDAPIIITDIKIFNRSLSEFSMKERNRITEKSPSYAKRITIPNKYNNFTIEFTALTFTHPELNRYAYKLEGFDEEWRYTSATRRFANYNNLNRGTYTFLLKASNENGTWSNEIKKLKITVLPPFWASWWAFLVYALLGAMMLYIIIRSVQNRIHSRNRLRDEEIERNKAEELNHAKLNFFTNITHELLTPLTILSASVDELKLVAPQYNSTYSVMGLNINRLIRLLQQILEFRKVESGNLKLRVIKGDMAEFVNKEIESFRPLIKKKKLHLSVICDPETIIGYFDPDKLDKILYNLLSNASKYNKDGGFIHITLKNEPEKGLVKIDVEDNGIGIPESDQRNLFTRFYEGGNRHYNTPGTGIGLSLSKDLVLLHKGSIRVESEKDKGTTFHIELPIEPDCYSDEDIDESYNRTDSAVYNFVDIDSHSMTEQAKGTPKEYTILVVEDDDLLRNLIVKLLAHEYNVLQAEDGVKAIQLVEDKEVDLIVTDLMMPNMDGNELCKRLKTSSDYSYIPIVVLTARKTEEYREEAYNAGADGYITKPFALSVLYAKIRSLLQKKEFQAKAFKKHHAIEIKDLNYTSSDELFLQHAIEIVQKHLDDPDLDQLQFVEEMNCSKSTLYKKIKFLTGLNTSAFICNIRLKAACKIIEEKKNLMISELAYAVGFSTPKYFSYCFKKEFGMLPSEYIERFQPDVKINYEEDHEN